MDEHRNMEIKKNMENTGEDEGKRPPTVTARDAWHARAEKTARQANHSKEMDGAAGGAGAADGSGMRYYGSAPPKKKTRKKPLLIFGSIVVGVLLIALLVGTMDLDFKKDKKSLSGASDATGDHVGVLYIEGNIVEGDSSYNHEYVLDCIDGMKDNEDNRAMMLYVNTPGGSVYESDEVYLKIRDYQKTTGRPVYVYMASQATSGGYYISASADKIAANRNCWTGSIGVIIGTLYDISGLLEEYDIQAENIVSGDNKAMGGITEPLSDEQREILQSLVDESYEQFVDVIVEGRGLSEAHVKRAADGRIYSALQAKELMLIDEVVDTFDDALADMKAEYSLEDCEILEYRYEPEDFLFGQLIVGMDKLAEAARGQSDIAALTELMEQNQSMPVQYMCEVKK